MFERFSNSWKLTKQSFAVLKSHPVLMAFPILSALATLLVIASFIVPIFYSAPIHELAQNHGRVQLPPLTYLILFAFYYCCYFVQTFFTCALMGSANMVLCGGKTSLKDGLGLAAGRMGQIAAWALVAATVGMVLRNLQERAGLVGKILIGLLGAAWSVLTYFIAPIIMFENQDVFAAVKRSGSLVKKTWGEGLSMGVTFAALNFAALLVWVVSGVALMVIHPLVGLAWMAGFLALWGIVASTAGGIFKVALYRYAWIGAKTDVFDPSLIETAFVQKKGRLSF